MSACDWRGWTAFCYVFLYGRIGMKSWIVKFTKNSWRKQQKFDQRWIWCNLYTQPKTSQACCKLSISLASCNLSFAETTCSQSVNNKFWQSTCNKSVDNLQQTCRQWPCMSQAMWTHPGISLLITSLLQDVNKLVVTCSFWLCITLLFGRTTQIGWKL